MTGLTMLKSGNSRSRTLWLGEQCAYFLVVAILASALSFVILDVLPGSSIDHKLAPDSTEQEITALMEEAGLNQPLYQRYANWLFGALRGDFGESSVTGQPVSEILTSKAPVTLALVAISQIAALGMSIVLAVLVTAPKRRAVVSAANSVLLVVLAVPHFVWAVLLIAGVAATVSFIPTSGYVAMADDPGDWLASIVLPAITLALIEIPVLGRLLIEELRACQKRNFTEYSRSLGYSELYILIRQCLPVALVPVITVFAMNLGALLSGAVIVETIFAIPGIGRALFTAISQKDYMLVQGCVMVAVFVYVVANLSASGFNAAVVKEQGRQE